MQTLNVVAASAESARALLEALSEFEAELIEAEDGHCEVSVTLASSASEIVAVLNALEEYVLDRGPARLSLDGHDYVMHPSPALVRPAPEQASRLESRLRLPTRLPGSRQNGSGGNLRR